MAEAGTKTPVVTKAHHRATSAKGPWLVRARRVVQFATFVAFMALLIATEIPTDGAPGDPIRVQGPTSIFLEMNPLVALSTTLATGALYDGLIWALPLLIATHGNARSCCDVPCVRHCGVCMPVDTACLRAHPRGGAA